MTLRTDGIVIREQTTGEQDRLVTVLTREKGVIRAFVNGGRNPKSKNVASTGLLCYSDFSIEKTKKDVYIIKEATAKELFFPLRENIVRLSLAQYFAELTYELAPREEQAGEFLSLILNSIHLITEGKKSLPLIKAATEMRMLCLSGYMPDIVSCCECGAYESEKMSFDVLTGELRCESCLRGKQDMAVALGTIHAMRHICLADKSKLYSFRIGGEALEDLCYLSERYLKNVTMRRYKTLDFYKSMCN